MAISAKRFTFLDAETNVPVSDFITASSSDILNSPQYDVMAYTDQLINLANANQIKDVGPILQRVNALPTLGLSRITRDFFSSYTDISGLNKENIANLTLRMFPNSTQATLRNTFGQIGVVCKSSILAGLGNCSNKKNLAILNGLKVQTNTRSCNIYAFVDLIKALTGGNYVPTMIDQCAIVRLISGIASRGFQLGLPNVFSSISGQIPDQYLLAQAGAIVMGSVAHDGNMYGVMDVATSSVGPMISALNPGICSTIMQNYQIPPEIREGDIGKFQTQFNAAMTNMEPSWQSMDYVQNTGAGFVTTQIPSLENLDPANSDLLKSYQCSAFDSNLTVPSLDGEVPDLSIDDLAVGGLTLDDSDVATSLKDLPGYIPGDAVDTPSSISFDNEW